jgi:hypothetical protein
MQEMRRHLQKFCAVFGKTRGKVHIIVNNLQNVKIILAFLQSLWYNMP